MQSEVLGFDGLEQCREIAFLSSSHLQYLLEILHSSSLHEHLVSLGKLLIRQLHQLDDIFRLGETLIHEGCIILQCLSITIGS